MPIFTFQSACCLDFIPPSSTASDLKPSNPPRRAPNGRAAQLTSLSEKRKILEKFHHWLYLPQDSTIHCNNPLRYIIQKFKRESGVRRIYSNWCEGLAFFLVVGFAGLRVCWEGRPRGRVGRVDKVSGKANRDCAVYLLGGRIGLWLRGCTICGVEVLQEGM